MPVVYVVCGFLRIDEVEQIAFINIEKVFLMEIHVLIQAMY